MFPPWLTPRMLGDFYVANLTLKQIYGVRLFVGL